ncbi:class I SAM-dependent methyltransferase [Paenibacillus qinlingensis]|uniref:SAM-dependent methyltransferase n=1 Tax=Paenibacillus qinlingensis TaxID=1837343 RepID=A0ABU1NR62_9BACL|nr:class I SAM-dependent methyltransferase [Paenibacillus qinlingensis]MDR6549944.1 SAM-dependent methyltransferase [Paenibacillus qinlingensis]
MKSLEQYWNETYQRLEATPTYDNWLDKYWEPYLSAYSSETLIVDLGCGVGNNTQYLFEHGLSPIACDISEEALMKLQSFLPDIRTRCLDMTTGLPFNKGTVQVLIADLSIHYFDEDTTHRIIRDLHSVLKQDGLLLVRLNSTSEIVNIREGDELYRRFFDRGEIEHFFDGDMWSYVHIAEYEMDRYTNKKMLWEIALTPRPE